MDEEDVVATWNSWILIYLFITLILFLKK
jgi:hypothetical protein